MTATASQLPEQHVNAAMMGAECWRCPLLGCNRGPVPSTIPPEAEFFVVAEAPGGTEVEYGRTLIGASGKELRGALATAGMDTNKVAFVNTIMCQPEGDLKRYLTQLKKQGKPSPVECCRPRLENDLSRAKFVLLMGSASLSGVQADSTSVMRVRGTPITLPSGTPALATPHAAFVMRDEGRTFRPIFHADIAKAVRLYSRGSTWRDPWYFVPRTAAEVANFLAVERPRVAVDVETDGKDPWTCNLRRIGIGTDTEVMIYSPLSVRGHWLLSADEIQAQTRVIADYFQRAPRMGLHNGIAFDSIVLWRHGMPLPDDRCADTMVGHQIGFTSELPHGLDFLGSIYTDAPFWKDSFKHSTVKDDNLLDKYLSFDIAVTYQAEPFIEQNLITAQQGHIYAEDADLFRIGRSMSALGIYIDPAARMAFAQEYQEKSERLRREFVAACGRDVNPNSPVQVRKLLYHDLGLPSLDEHQTDSGDPSTDESTLLDLLSLGVNDQARKIIQAILGCREAEKILGTNTGHIENGQLVGGPPVHPDGRVRTGWRPGKRAGRWGSSDPINCFSGDTEVLTRGGWVRFDRLKKDVKVAQWNDGQIEFVHPTGYVRKHADELVSIKLTQIDLLVTPDHRCMVRSKQTGRAHVFAAEDFPQRQTWEQLHAGVYHGGTYDFGDARLRLLVATQADGSYGYGDRVCFSFRRLRKAKRLEKLLDACAAVYKYKIRKNGRHDFEVRGAVAERCRAVLGPKKTFGSWVLDLTRTQLDAFCEEVFHWDGSWTRRNTYSSSIKRNADIVQAAFLLSGCRARIRKYRNRTPNAKINYQVDVTRRDWSGVANRKLKRVAGRRVYCVSVPSSFILVRRNGTAVVTGQCQNIPKKLRAMFKPYPGNIYVAADMSAVELRKIALLSNDEPLIEAFRAFDAKQGPDVHVKNACDVFRCEPKAVTDEVRNFIKRFVYALSYDAQPPKIYQTLSLLRDDNLKPLFPHITLSEVQRVYDLWWKLHPAIPVWKKKLIHGWRAQHFIETAYHKRKRYFIGGEKAEEMGNHPIQGSCADMHNDSIRNLTKAYPFDFANHRGLVVNGHDQLVVECAEREGEEVKHLVRSVMERRIGPMLFPAEPKAGGDWKAVS